MLLFNVRSQFGIETTSFIAIFSALVFVIDLALQGSLRYFASSILLLVFKPYQVGDLVDLNVKVGVVMTIQVFNTILRTVDNKRIIIPNRVVASGVITNISGQGEIRVDMAFGIGYSRDIDKARAVIHSVAQSYERVMKDKEVDVFVAELTDSSVNFVVHPWAKASITGICTFPYTKISRKHSTTLIIEIPFPLRSIHMMK